MFSPEVDDSFKSVKEISELIENSKYFKTNKRTIDNNANGDNIVSTNINGNLTNKVSKKNQSCDSLRNQFRFKPTNNNHR